MINILRTMLLLLLVLTTAVAAKERTISGKPQKLGDGSIYPWVKFNNDKLTAIGVTFSEKMLENLPVHLPAGQESLERILTLPKQAAKTVFNHIGVNWNPRGHEPTSIYDIGHFDFHFYLISTGQRKQITAAGDDLLKVYKPFEAEYTPAGYVLAPDSALAGMGAHWIDPNSHEFHGMPFTKTLIYGSYAGKLTFIEPMITKAFLETKPDVSEPFNTPAKYTLPGFYPTRYRISFDAARKEYSVSLEQMMLR